MAKAISKVTYNNNVLIDITDSTITKNVILKDYKAYGADGQSIIGALDTVGNMAVWENDYGIY